MMQKPFSERACPRLWGGFWGFHGGQARPLNAVIVLLVVGCATAHAQTNRLTPDEIRAGWILLFDGETTFGWHANSNANWNVADGAIRASDGEPGVLVTNSEFGDFELQLEFRVSAATNSGVFLRTVEKPTDPAIDCYELNIASEGISPFPTGSLVKRQKGIVPPASADWQHYEVTAKGGQIVVKLNGKQLLDYTDPQSIARGRIGLQFNTGPVAFRNIKLRPLGLKSLFNGKDLTGWKVYPGKTSRFTVVDGEINVIDGPGALESDAQFGDFILQLEARTNGRGLNSGVFFRSIPGEYTNGYESQIHNAFIDGDRTKPADCGTGGIFRRQNARRVVADDLEWFTKTIIATGPHMAVWVNGIQVSDWTDTRKPNTNPRRGYRASPGTLQLQGHDPTTDLRFRNLRAAEVR